MCVLRAFGNEFKVDEFLIRSSLIPCAVFRKGEPGLIKTSQQHHELSGFYLDVSPAGLDDFKRQIADAIAFLQQYGPEIDSLRNFPGVEEIYLDFAVGLRRPNVMKSFRFNRQLLREAVRHGVEIEMTVYQTEDEA